MNRWNEAFSEKGNEKGAEMIAARDTFLKVYARFIREIVAQDISKQLEVNQEAIVHQSKPIFRVVYPGQMATGTRHCDADYCHQPNEVNVWIPLTVVYSTNSLWVESRPGKANYRPIESRSGEAFRFYGNQCEHFTCANTTEHTRVSFDLRVVPQKLHDPSYREKVGKGAGLQS